MQSSPASRSLLALALLCASAALVHAADEAKLSVTSPAFQAGGNIPAQFTCKGGNVNPPIRFGGIPAGAKTLAVIVDDPDAPSGLFTHWLLWNVANVAEIRQNNVAPGSVQGTNDFGKIGYGGPCPPSGTHRYYFRILALDTELGLKSGAKRADLEKAIAGHVLARGELMGRFSH